MKNDNFNFSFYSVGRTTCSLVFIFGILYAIITTLGLFSLRSPHDIIGNPYFTIMEILTIIISLLMTISLISVHHYSASADKLYSLIALILICFTTVITSSIHFLILSVSNTTEAKQLQNFSFFFSFKWPSVAYALDILAWDLFFGLSMLFVAIIFKKNRFEKKLRALLIICGILCLIGLIGIPLQDMQIRNIGIIGYAVIGPIAFLLIGIIFRRQMENERANKTNA